MSKIYHVIIKGKTLESRDLKELLARAVSAKRNLDCRAPLRARLHGQTHVQHASNPYGQSPQSAVL